MIESQNEDSGATHTELRECEASNIEDAAATPYTLDTSQLNDAPRTTGFIIQTMGKPDNSTLCERDLLHPVYGDFPRLRPGGRGDGIIPPKSELLKEVNDELYRTFTKAIIKQMKRDEQVINISFVVCGGLLLIAGFTITDENKKYGNLGFYMLFGSIAMVILISCYESYNRVDLVQEYKHEFAKHAILVEEVEFYSDYYTSYRYPDGLSTLKRDRSTYVVFSELSAGNRKKVVGDGQFDFLPDGPRII